MSEPPGRVGLPVVCDQSLYLLQDPMQYFASNIASYGRVFKARIMNTPTVIVTSAAAIRGLLVGDGEEVTLRTAYRPIMRQLYGENLISTESVDAHRVASKMLKQCMCDGCVASYLATTTTLTAEMLSDLDDQGVQVYHVFKQFSLRLSLQLLLGVQHDDSLDEAELIQLITDHWRGLTSLPLSVKVWQIKSGNASALEAKEKLLEILKHVIKNRRGSPSRAEHRSVVDHAAQSKETVDNIAEQLLLCLSNVLPKALSSLLTWAVIETGKPQNALFSEQARRDKSMTRKIVREVERLHPPFFCSARRVAIQSTTTESFAVPKDWAVLCVASHANRDPALFPQADRFDPNATEEGVDNFTYGHGLHKCIGRQLMEQVISHVTQFMLDNYTWEVPEVPGEKWFPVNRPEPDIVVCFEKRIQ